MADTHNSTTGSATPAQGFAFDQIYVVTGAGRGIGQSIAQELLERGARVMGIDLAFDWTPSTNVESLLLKQVCDVSSETSVQQAFDCLEQEIAASDNTLVLKGLVNCAGIVLERKLVDTSVADIHRVLGVNLVGPILCARATIRHVQKHTSSKTATAGTVRCKVINIASELGHLGREDYSIYCATKGGIVSLTRSWAREFASLGILVNAVAPGPTDTQMLQSESNYDAWKDTADGIPLGRIGRPQDIASIVCFLLNPSEANFMTGSTVDVNGGAAMY